MINKLLTKINSSHSSYSNYVKHLYIDENYAKDFLCSRKTTICFFNSKKKLIKQYLLNFYKINK